MNSSTQPTLARLRALTPPRGLTLFEALGIAERQAAVLLAASNVTTAPVSIAVIGRLPHIQLAVGNLPSAGASFWTGENWRIVANRADALVRQRFTLAHELKHVIDHPGRDLYYSDHATRETVADCFAACLLMPKVLVVRAWCSGEQDIDRLADHFAVSAEAMTRRLLKLGLLTERPIRPIFCTRGLKPLQSRASVAINTIGDHLP